MTPEDVIVAAFPCACDDAYTARGRHSPYCLHLTALDALDVLAERFDLVPKGGA